MRKDETEYRKEAWFLTQNKNENESMRQRRSATRKLLWTWGNTLNRIRRLEDERTAFREMADDARRTLRATSLNDMPKGGVGSDLSDVIIHVMDMAEEYERVSAKIDAEIIDAMRLRNCIEDCVSQLPPVQEKIVGYRYIDERSWQFIAMKMNYDERSVRRIEAQAVDAISRMIEIATT